jgi:hypothetical protein
MTYLVLDQVENNTLRFDTLKELLSFLNSPNFDDPDKVADEVKVFKGEEVYIYTKPQVHICETPPGA